MNEHKHIERLYRNTDDAMIAGVLAGFAERFSVDPTILRILYVFIALVTGFFPLALAYLLAVVIMPRKPLTKAPEATYDEKGNRLY